MIFLRFNRNISAVNKEKRMIGTPMNFIKTHMPAKILEYINQPYLLHGFFSSAIRQKSIGRKNVKISYALQLVEITVKTERKKRSEKDNFRMKKMQNGNNKARAKSEDINICDGSAGNKRYPNGP